LQQHQHPLTSEPNASSGEVPAGEGLHVRFSTSPDAAQKSTQPVTTQPQKHAESLAKAVRGFTKTTLRDMQSHDAFKSFPCSSKEGMEKDAINDELLACLETFVFRKCHNAIYRVLGAELEEGEHDQDSGPSKALHNSRRTYDEIELELKEKIKLLQFVTPQHLEIQCLKVAPDDSIDLSHSIDHIRSIKHQSSPRQKLRSILLAYRGINASLNAVLNKQRGDTPSPSPPSADDVLPTLILAVLRCQPEKIVTDLRFVEFFATVSLLRGEAGYAYTNFCGALQFLKNLDMEGHAAEVSLGEESAHLSISPDDFRAGIERSKQAMKLIKVGTSKEEEDPSRIVNTNQGSIDEIHLTQYNVGQALQYMNISGRDIREARASGETINIDWALRKQKDVLWQNGKVESASPALPNVHVGQNLPPEEPPLPAHFNRSYSYLSTRPDDIRMSDLPKLLNEYRMLVHATESLLNERSAWRESEKRRQMQLARANLERDFNEVVGQSFCSAANNGRDNKS
jgi:hypothetical protein